MTKSTNNQNTSHKIVDFAFGRINYILMIVGIIILALGYILMIGGGSNDLTKFNPDLFNFQRLSLAPAVLLLGFIVEICAIMIRPKK